jgi:hypothetical protein
MAATQTENIYLTHGEKGYKVCPGNESKNTLYRFIIPKNNTSVGFKDISFREDLTIEPPMRFISLENCKCGGRILIHLSSIEYIYIQHNYEKFAFCLVGDTAKNPEQQGYLNATTDAEPPTDNPNGESCIVNSHTEYGFGIERYVRTLLIQHSSIKGLVYLSKTHIRDILIVLEDFDMRIHFVDP